ncbi:hypothetical protein [Variovorax sp. AFSI2.2]|uniref:hypothetical protein n=1 Tax=Variovorax sp. AFSI2.2 TaxID=3384160 RepID=UPI003EB75BBA
MTCFPFEDAGTAPAFGAAVEAADAALEKPVATRAPAATETPPASRLRRVGVAVKFLLFVDMVRSFFDVVVNAG